MSPFRKNRKYWEINHIRSFGAQGFALADVLNRILS